MIFFLGGKGGFESIMTTTIKKKKKNLYQKSVRHTYTAEDDHSLTTNVPHCSQTLIMALPTYSRATELYTQSASSCLQRPSISGLFMLS